MSKQKAETQCSMLKVAFLVCVTFGALHISASTLGPLSSAHYVQDGLVLHFDGIENVGAGLAHDSSAMSWKDLSKSGNNVSFVAISGGGDDMGHWTSNGYSFAGNSFGLTDDSLDIAPNLKATVQTVSAYNNSDQRASYSDGGINYNFYPTVFGATFGSGNSRQFSIYSESTSAHLRFNALNLGQTPCWSWQGRYATAVLNEGARYLFQADIPTVALDAGSSTTVLGARRYSIGCDGGPASARSIYYAMTGTIHAVRAYNRVLTNDEFAWNRIIDDYRFFGISTTCLPTNAVVVASEMDGFEGREPNGMYIPSEWTFTMSDTSSTNMVGNKGYSFAGYVLETWDAATGTWTNPVTNLTDSTWTSPSGDESWTSRRLTWIWKVVYELVPVPDVDSYVQDGLVLHLDGFRNVGVDAPHNASAASWVELAGGKTATFTHTEEDSSAWTDNGYYFGGRSLAIMDGNITLFTTATVQVACNVDTSIQQDATPRLMGTMNTGDWLAIYCMTNSGALRFKLGDNIAGDMSSWGGSYVTGMCTGEKRAFFQTAVPTTLTSFSKSVGGARTVTVGGARGNTATYYANCYLIGEINNLRIYNRALTDAELEQNRAVDEARRGRSPNVTVVESPYGESVESPGLYEVKGEWTFTATNVVDSAGAARAVVGYSLETAQNGEWSAPVRYAGSSYTYRAGESPQQVRLKWRLAVGFRMILR